MPVCWYCWRCKYRCSHMVPLRLNTAGKPTWEVSWWAEMWEKQVCACPSWQVGKLNAWQIRKEHRWAFPGLKRLQCSGQMLQAWMRCRHGCIAGTADFWSQTNLLLQVLSLREKFHTRDIMDVKTKKHVVFKWFQRLRLNSIIVLKIAGLLPSKWQSDVSFHWVLPHST